MSHFTVLVIGENIEEQLAPYQENNMEDCPQQYLEFTCVEEQERKEYENGTTERVIMPDGRLLSPYDEEFRVPRSIGTSLFNSHTHKVPEHLEKREIPYIELFSTFEDYMEKCTGRRKDDVTGKYGYWENPNAKWDWYQIGGRWTGFFKLKETSKGKLGNPSLVFRKEAQIGYADQALKKDIDFEGMIKDAQKKAAERYDKVISVLGHQPKLAYTWEQIVAEIDDTLINTTIDKKREIYWEQPDCKLWKSKEKELHEIKGVGFFTDAEQFMVDKETYIKIAGEKAFETFAIIKDGKWWEKGKMGWWACVSNEKTHDTWNKTFMEIIAETADNELLTVVDCHI